MGCLGLKVTWRKIEKVKGVKKKKGGGLCNRILVGGGRNKHADLD